MWAAASAARRCGSIMRWPRRPRGWRVGRCGCRCRVRASTASSAGGPRRSSASRSGRTRTACFKAMIQTGVVAMTDHNNMPEPFITPAMALYAAETMKLSVETAHMDMLANTFMRAPGHAPGSFAQESARRRVGREDGDGPDRTAHPQRAGEGPGEGPAVLDAQPGAVLPRRGDPIRLERARRDGEQVRWRVADRPRHGVGDVSLPADAGRRGADHPHGRGQGDRRDRGRRDGHGHHDDDGDGGRRSARPEARGCDGRDR